jgi:ComF family protein
MGRQADKWFERLGGLLLPPRCVLCGGRGQPPCLDLCLDCQASLPAAAVALCEPAGPVRRLFAPFAYGWPIDHLVQGLKYRARLANARVLGTLLAARVEALALHDQVDVIVPVPLHPARLAERGFNQSIEIARPLARRLGRRLEPTLASRLRPTAPQVGLHLPDRSRNLVGAFTAQGVRGRRVALVDDVTTSGSTLQELAGTLLQAGATAVDGWCVTRAERGIHGGPTGEPSPWTGPMR